MVRLKLALPASAEVERTVWSYNEANWVGLEQDLQRQNWNDMWTMSVDQAAEFLTTTIMELSTQHIPQRKLKVQKCTHPWLNDKSTKLVQTKIDAVGTEGEKEAAKACSTGLLAEYNAWVARTKARLQALPRMAK